MTECRHRQRGFTLIELLIGLVLMLFVMAGLFGMLIDGSHINKSKKLTIDTQANARSTLSLLVQKLRSAGWDPMNAGLATVTLDADLSDDVSEIEIFSDIDADGDTDGYKEQIWVRHQNGRIEWRPTGDTSVAFVVMAPNISNDADGDGTIEPMFVPDSSTPTRIRVQITARSPMPDPLTGDYIRYTVASDVSLRKRLE